MYSRESFESPNPESRPSKDDLAFPHEGYEENLHIKYETLPGDEREYVDAILNWLKSQYRLDTFDHWSKKVHKDEAERGRSRGASKRAVVTTARTMERALYELRSEKDPDNVAEVVDACRSLAFQLFADWPGSEVSDEAVQEHRRDKGEELPTPGQWIEKWKAENDSEL